MTDYLEDDPPMQRTPSPSYPPARVRLFSTPEACALAGATVRQADYWARIGVVTPSVPAVGMGSRRRWAWGEVLALRAGVLLGELGAQAPSKEPALVVLSDPERWEEPILVLPDGRVVPARARMTGWLLDLPKELYMIQRRLAALDSEAADDVDLVATG